MNATRIVHSHEDTKYLSGVSFGEGTYTQQATKRTKEKEIHTENPF